MARTWFAQICLFLALYSFAFAQAQWSPPRCISQTPVDDYSKILAVGDTLHVVFNSHHPGVGYGIGYLRSADAGLTWSTQRELADTANTNPNQRCNIMAFGPNLMAVWWTYFPGSFHERNIAYSVSRDNGATWAVPAYIFDPNWDLIGEVNATNIDSVIIIVFNANINSELTYFSTRSTDFGASWSDTLRLFVVDGASRPDQAASNGVIHYAWGGRFVFGDSYDVYYIRSTDGGLSWSPNVMLSEDDDHPSQAPALAVDELGNPAISWWDFKYSPYQLTGDILARWSRDMGGNWLPESQVTRHHLAILSDISWVRDTIRVVWLDWRFENFTIFYSFADAGVGIWSPEERLDDSQYDSRGAQIAASNGRIYVIWDGNYEQSGVYFTRYPDFPDAVDEGQIPNRFEGLWAYPNPFNAATTITVAGKDKAEIAIYDVTGRKVATLHAENGKAVWEAGGLTSGLYFARAADGTGDSDIIRLVYLK
jgi:hypothetical protein